MLRWLLLTSLLFTFACSRDSAKKNVPLPSLGTASVPVTYTDFADVEGLFRQTDNTIYVINFWATWCKPCLEELPLLNRLARAYPGLRIVTVSLDRKPGGLERVPEVLEKTAPELPAVILTDPDDAAWGKTIDRVWSGSLPTTIIYRGELRYVYRRAFNTYADLERAVEPLVR